MSVHAPKPGRRKLGIVLVMMGLLLAATSASAESERPRMLVLSLKSGAGFPADQAKLLDELISIEVSKYGVFDVLSDADVRRLMELESERQALGCDDEGCLAEVAGAMGARYVLAGRIGKLGSRITLVLNLFDSQAAKGIWRDSRSGSTVDAIADALPDIVGAMMKESMANAGIGEEAIASSEGQESTEATVSAKPAETKAAATSTLPPPDAPIEAKGGTNFTYLGLGAGLCALGFCTGCTSSLLAITEGFGGTNGRVDVYDYTYAGGEACATVLAVSGLGLMVSSFFLGDGPADDAKAQDNGAEE